MSAIQKLLTEHLDIWTAADTGPRSGRGRSSGNAGSVYGVKKLRELILELAVRGKLVPQDAEDEPASELLKRIQAEKVKLVAAGKIKKDKPLSEITDAEKPFELPQGWEWVKLGAITNFGSTVKLDSIDDYTWVLDLEDIEKDTSNLLQKIRFSERGSLSDKNRFHRGDVLYGKLRPYLNKVIVADEDGVCTTEILPIRCHGPFNSDYFKTALKSPYFIKYVTKRSYGMKMPRLGTEDGRQAAFPLPPLAEQHRIVAKVDELMALCDQLEAGHNNASAAHEQLVSQLLSALTQAPDAEAFSENWQRIATHFDTLFTTEASINTLKQTLLQLAVMGKLVPQDPNDEPASELLKKIRAEKDRLIKEGKIKKDKTLPPVTEKEKPIVLPKGWVWIRLSEVSELITSGSRDWAKYLSDDGAIFVTMGNLSRGSYDLRLENMRYVNPPKTGEGSRTRLEAHDLLISITGDVGNLGRIPEGFGEAYINQHTCLLRFLPLCRNRYFPEVLRSPIAASQFNAPQRGVKNSFRLGDVDGIEIPLPPLSEQHRIVAKVDELMALCDHLKSRLTEASQLQQKLADVLVENAVVGKVLSGKSASVDGKENQEKARTLLAAEVVHQLSAEKFMGRTKLQKVVYLAEYVAGLKEVASEPLRDAAGPHDRHLMDQIREGMKTRQWYEEYTLDDGKSYHYRHLAQAGQHHAAYKALWSSEQHRNVHDLIELMRSWTTGKCEQVATLYAAWNDLLIEGEEATEAAILNEIMNRWNDSKLNYTEAKWQTELTAMKKHTLLIPTGFGRRTTGGMQALLLH